MAPLASRPALLWSLPPLVIFLGLLWYRRKRNAADGARRSDTRPADGAPTRKDASKRVSSNGRSDRFSPAKNGSRATAAPNCSYTAVESLGIAQVLELNKSAPTRPGYSPVEVAAGDRGVKENGSATHASVPEETEEPACRVDDKRDLREPLEKRIEQLARTVADLKGTLASYETEEDDCSIDVLKEIFSADRVVGEIKEEEQIYPKTVIDTSFTLPDEIRTQKKDFTEDLQTTHCTDVHAELPTEEQKDASLKAPCIAVDILVNSEGLESKAVSEEDNSTSKDFTEETFCAVSDPIDESYHKGLESEVVLSVEHKNQPLTEEINSRSIEEVHFGERCAEIRCNEPSQTSLTIEKDLRKEEVLETTVDDKIAVDTGVNNTGVISATVGPVETLAILPTTEDKKVGGGVEELGSSGVISSVISCHEVPVEDDKEEWNTSKIAGDSIKAVNCEEISTTGDIIKAVNFEEISTTGDSIKAVNLEEISTASDSIKAVNSAEISITGDSIKAVNFEEILTASDSIKSVNFEEISTASDNIKAVNSEEISTTSDSITAINSAEISIAGDCIKAVNSEEISTADDSIKVVNFEEISTASDSIKAVNSAEISIAGDNIKAVNSEEISTASDSIKAVNAAEISIAGDSIKSVNSEEVSTADDSIKVVNFEEISTASDSIKAVNSAEISIAGGSIKAVNSGEISTASDSIKSVNSEEIPTHIADSETSVVAEVDENKLNRKEVASDSLELESFEALSRDVGCELSEVTSKVEDENKDLTTTGTTGGSIEVNCETIPVTENFTKELSSPKGLCTSSKLTCAEVIPEGTNSSESPEIFLMKEAEEKREPKEIAGDSSERVCFEAVSVSAESSQPTTEEAAMNTNTMGEPRVTQELTGSLKPDTERTIASNENARSGEGRSVPTVSRDEANKEDSAEETALTTAVVDLCLVEVAEATGETSQGESSTAASEPVERDSANHSPAEGMLGSPGPCNYSDVQSENSSDSGKGGSDVPSPPSRTPASGSSLSGDPPAAIVYEFVLPQHLVGRLIGRHGYFVNHIKAQTNASILIKRHPETSRLKICAVEGTQIDIESALEMIRYKFPAKRYPNVTLEQVSFLPPAFNNMITDTMRLRLVEGVNNDVILSRLVTPAHFFLQQPTHPSFPALIHLCSGMNMLYKGNNTPSLPTVEVGNVVAAPSQESWYRAEVVAVDSENNICEVRFLDYGGYETLDTSQLRQIRGDFLHIPFQATECYLANIICNSADGEWNPEAATVIEQLTAGRVLQAHVCGYSEDGLPVVNLYVNRGSYVVPVNKELVARGLVEWWEPDCPKEDT